MFHLVALLLGVELYFSIACSMGVCSWLDCVVQLLSPWPSCLKTKKKITFCSLVVVTLGSLHKSPHTYENELFHSCELDGSQLSNPSV